MLSCSNRQMVRETSRSQHFCHIVPSHIFTINRPKKPELAWDTNSKLLDICCHILSCKSRVQADLLSFSTSLFCLLLGVSLHPSLNSSSPSIGDNISPPKWEWFEGIQLNESMSEVGGYFRECHFFFFQLLASFPGLPLLSHTSKRVEHQCRSASCRL